MKKILIFVCLLSCGLVLAAPHYPSPQGHITDAANILDSQSRQQLERQLADFERQSSIEIAVAAIPSLEGETIESYAVGLFKYWGVGKKGKDNGVLLLVAPNDRKVRFEVGYGLEPKLPDGLCGQIIRENMTPPFRSHRYAEGIGAGIQALENALTGEPPPTPRPDAVEIPRILAFLLFFIFPFVLVGIIRYSLFRIGGGYWGAGWGGGFGGGGGFSGGGGFGGFGGGSSGGGGASGSW